MTQRETVAAAPAMTSDMAILRRNELLKDCHVLTKQLADGLRRELEGNPANWSINNRPARYLIQGFANLDEANRHIVTKNSLTTEQHQTKNALRSALNLFLSAQETCDHNLRSSEPVRALACQALKSAGDLVAALLPEFESKLPVARK